MYLVGFSVRIWRSPLLSTMPYWKPLSVRLTVSLVLISPIILNVDGTGFFLFVDLDRLLNVTYLRGLYQVLIRDTCLRSDDVLFRSTMLWGEGSIPGTSHIYMHTYQIHITHIHTCIHTYGTLRTAAAAEQ